MCGFIDGVGEGWHFESSAEGWVALLNYRVLVGRATASESSEKQCRPAR